MRVEIGTFEATPSIIDRVIRVLKDGRLSYGPESQELEQEFARVHHNKYGVLSNSGTSSLVVALQALKEMHGWPDGSEVIIPAITFVATANAVIQCRMVPVPVDVDPKYYDISSYQVADNATDDTVAVIAVNVFGKPADLPTLAMVCSAYGLVLIEDSCEAMGVGINQRPVGSWGRVGIFSFYMAHILTCGVGGMAITDDYDLAKKMRSLVNHGISVENLPGPDRYDPAFLGRNFEFETIGHSFRITELEAAIGIEQLKMLDDIIERRQAVAEHYNNVLDPQGGMIQKPTVRLNSRSSWMMYPIIMCNMEKYNMMRWLRENNIECRDMLPLISQPCYEGMFDLAKYPIANWIDKHGFYIGCHQGTTWDQQEYVAQTFFEYRRFHAS
jgi:dTDP-4-amino-4,6-dideoxygalactose transaminase